MVVLPLVLPPVSGTDAQPGGAATKTGGPTGIKLEAVELFRHI